MPLHKVQRANQKPELLPSQPEPEHNPDNLQPWTILDVLMKAKLLTRPSPRWSGLQTR